MKILLINPRLSFRKTNKFSPSFIFSKLVHFDTLAFKILCSNTPPEHEVIYKNEEFDDIDYNTDSDLIGISATTSQAINAYKIADNFRNKGKKVIIGGWHASALPHEAKQHADSVAIGEAEVIWPEILNDHENNSLKPYYKYDKTVDPKYFSTPNRYLKRHFKLADTIQATRGCPNRCEFCSISNMKHRRIYRKRPIEDVINEVRNIKQKHIFISDASLTIDKEYTKELLRNLADLNKTIIRISGNVNDLNKDVELLELADKAGCIAWFVGFESISQESINIINKRTNDIKNYKSMVKKIHDNNMVVMGSFVFGIDADKKDIFRKTSDFINDIELDSVNFCILTPLPGTPLFDRMENENRLITKDWSKYTFEDVVFKPKNMNPEDLLNGTKEISKEFFSYGKILNRMKRNLQYKRSSFLWTTSQNLSGRTYYKNAFDN